MSNGIALPNGTYVEEYKIEKELGAGTFGVTYLATDTNLDKQVVIKEYLPNDIAIRQDSVTIMPKSKGDVENFEYGLDSFTKEAKVLAKFNHPNIVKVSRLFHKNGTAYFVMDYDEGEDLQEYIKRHSSFSEEEILSIIMPILDGLRDVHASDFLHRDIKPGNIYIRNNSSPMLIDFGASRMAMGIKSKSLSVVLTEGYAPKEQYSSTSKQGAYTDLYAIGAVMYKMATGITPPEASARADAITDDEPDPIVLLQNRDDLDYSDSFKEAVDWALKFSGKNRPQGVVEFQEKINIRTKNKTPYQKPKTTNTNIEQIQSNLKVRNKGSRTLKGHLSDINSIDISLDGFTIISGSSDKTIKVWFLNSGKLLQTLKNHSNNVNTISIGSNDKIFASGSSDKTVKICDINTGKVLKTLKGFFQGHIAPVLSISISQNNQFLVSSGADWSIKLWHINHEMVKDNLLGHSDVVTSVVISNDSKNIISASLDKTIKVWDTTSGKLIKTLKGHTEGVTSVSISKCNNLIISGSLDKTIKIWKNGKVIHTLKGHKYYINDVKISDDGKLIVSGSADCSVRIWDTKSGVLLKTLQEHTMPVQSVAINHNNTTIVSGSKDKTIKIWDITLSDTQSKGVKDE